MLRSFYDQIVKIGAKKNIMKFLEYVFKKLCKVFNSHDTDVEKCVEIIKTLHVKFFPLCAPEPNRIVTVNTLLAKAFLFINDFSKDFESSLTYPCQGP